MLALEFLVHGATKLGEPGVFLMFEESAAELSENVRSLGFDLDALQEQQMLVLDHVHVDRSEILETGEYNLDGLFIRLGYAIDTIGAKRVVLDTLEALFGGLPDEGILRAELRRLFRWLKDRGVSAIITGERGREAITRHGLEEYVADCVLLLDHRVEDNVSTRWLRVVKYRGSAHGTNEYPFMIGAEGVSVLPITSLRLEHEASTERISVGNSGIDEMLGGLGVYRGSSVLVTGSPGAGKSSVGATIADATCRRGERAMLFVFEESASQLLRNMKSIGLDLQHWIDAGLLQVHASRPTHYGLEQHLMLLHDTIGAFKPSVVVVDPISNLSLNRQLTQLEATLMRLVDMLKQQQITGVFTNLTSESGAVQEVATIGVSSLMDTWLVLSNMESNSERIRTIQVVKSRGMPHSNQVREFELTHNGIQLFNVVREGARVVTGAARAMHNGAEHGAVVAGVR